MPDRILVVDDETVLRNNLLRYLRRSGHDVDGVASAEAALDAIAARDYALVITDLRMPGMGGAALLERVAEERPETLLLVITAFASLDSALAALRAGAQDYLLKPLSLEALGQKVARLLHMRALEARVRWMRQELRRDHDPSGMIADAPAMQPVVRLLHKAAGSRSTVLIHGESGTGKELIARALHDLSPWADKDFIAVNLAAQPRELVDATLFGHERGAYTGAAKRRDGVFRAARGGTVFLDEIGEMSPEVQVKLLRVLESREVLPLGADRPVAVDFRLVTATHRSLRARVAEGAFREDLFYRIEVLTLELPPLRERTEDIPALARTLLARHVRRQGGAPPRLSNAAMRALQSHRWPGNIRELSNALERALLLCDGEVIEAADLPVRVEGAGMDAATVDLKTAVSRFEREHIRRVLGLHKGDKQAAAAALGVHLATLYRHIERLGLGAER